MINIKFRSVVIFEMEGRRRGKKRGKDDIGESPQVAFTILVAFFLKLLVGASMFAMLISIPI